MSARCYTCKTDISERKIDGKQAIFCEAHENARSNLAAGVLVNGGIERKGVYKREVDKGVKGRDLLQPFTEDGKYNKDFFHHHGDKAFTNPLDKERIKRELG
jgi:hypothetical protein